MRSDRVPDPPAGLPAALLVTSQAPLREEVGRLAAAVGVEVRAVDDIEAGGTAWIDAGLVLLGDDAAGLGSPLRRAGVVLVCPAEAGEGVWRAAVQSGAEAVARLPQDELWLLERLAVLADGAERHGVLVGVVGARGGAGASTLAAGLAVAAADRCREVLLVDGDPSGGELDLLLGADGVAGLCWPDLTGVQGALRGGVLREGLPRAAGTRLLSWGREDPVELPASAMEGVLDAARRAHDLVVVDLARHVTPAGTAALWRLDHLIVVVPAEVRAAAGARRLVERVSSRVADVRLVVRGPAPTSLTAEVVADAVGLPLSALCADEPALAADSDHGVAPCGRARSPLAALCRELLEDLAGPSSPVRGWPSAEPGYRVGAVA